MDTKLRSQLISIPNQETTEENSRPVDEELDVDAHVTKMLEVRKKKLFATLKLLKSDRKGTLMLSMVKLKLTL